MIDPQDADEVAAAYGLGGEGAPVTLTGPVAAGHVGRIHRLNTPSGPIAVKELLKPVAEVAAARDAAYQDAVRAAGVPMPAVLRTPAGSVTVTVRGATVRCYTWVDVLGPSRRLNPVMVGRVVAGVHRVVVPADGPPPAWGATPVGPEAWSDLVERLRRAGAPFATGLASLLPAVLETEAVVRPPDRLQMCHSDLWSDNVLGTPEGGVVVLDWENCGPGDPSRELAVVVYDLGGDSPGQRRRLYDAYVSAGGPGRLREPGDLSTLVVQLHHIVVAGCEQWLTAYAAGDDDGCETAACWVREFVDDPLLPETLDELLAAAR